MSSSGRDVEQRAQRQAVESMRWSPRRAARLRGEIARRDYLAVERLIQQEEKMDPRDHGVEQVRAELNAARQQAGRAGHRRVGALVAQARAAVSHKDYATADRLLDQAEDINPRNREVQQARSELDAAARPEPGPGRR